MTITICGSMQFHEEMLEVKTGLEALGHAVFVPSGAFDKNRNEYYAGTDEERVTVKIEHDLIREHFRYIDQSDAILVLNYDKKGITNYIGGNTFLEMGYAFGRDKKIFLLQPNTGHGLQNRNARHAAGHSGWWFFKNPVMFSF